MNDAKVAAPNDSAATRSVMKRPARVATLLDTLRGGGAERIAVEIAAALDRDRYAPLVVATREGGILEETLIRENVDYTILGRRRGFSPKRLRQAHRLLAQSDLIHAHMLGSNLWGSFFSRVAGAALIAHEPTFSGTKSKLRTHGYRFVIAPVARSIVCPSPVVARSLVDDGVPRTRIDVIPNGVRLDAAVPRNVARSNLGLHPDAYVVGIVAGLRVEKAHEVLLRAVARLRTEGRQVTVCVVGDGVRRSWLEDEATRLGLDRTVVWAGQRPDAKTLPAAFDVGVICSDYEGLPVAALEILAAGVPLVSTAVGTMPNILADGGGLTVPVRDDVAMAHAIARFLDDPELAARASRRAREIVQQDYSFDRMVLSVERLYDRVLGQAHPARR